MLAGEKVLLYLSRLETLVEQINDLRKGSRIVALFVFILTPLQDI